jgi:hypothetical protein
MRDRAPPSYSGPVEYVPREQVSPERAATEASLRAIPGVEGVGEGRDRIGDPAWIAYVRDRSVAARLPARLGGRAVVPEVSGEIGILPAR